MKIIYLAFVDFFWTQNVWKVGWITCLSGVLMIFDIFRLFYENGRWFWCDKNSIGRRGSGSHW